MEIEMLCKLAAASFLVLFFINWACLLSSQKIFGFRWGDFVLMMLFACVLFANMDRIKEFGKIFPDTIAILMMEPKAKIKEIQTGIDDTQKTVGVVSEYLKGVAQRELEYQMKYSVPQ